MHIQAWRMHVAQKSGAARRARDSMHHMLLTTNSQVSGHVRTSSKSVSTTIDTSLLHLTLEIGFLQRLLLYCCELAEARPLVDAAGLRLHPQISGNPPGLLRISAWLLLQVVSILLARI